MEGKERITCNEKYMYKSGNHSERAYIEKIGLCKSEINIKIKRMQIKWNEDD